MQPRDGDASRSPGARMELHGKISWSRLLAESVIIVLSILLAFGIDAWWQGRAERAKEEAALVGLARDFAGHRETLRFQVEAYESRLEAAERLLTALGPRAEGEGAATVTALATVGFVSPVRFQGGTLETLMGTDGLAILRDDSLRVALTRWRQTTTDLEGINEFVTTESRYLLDYLRTRYPLQDLDRTAGMVDVPPSEFEGDLPRILRDLEFSNITYQQYYATLVMLSYLRSLADVADEVWARVGR